MDELAIHALKTRPNESIENIERIAISQLSDESNYSSSDAWWDFVKTPDLDKKSVAQELAVAGMIELDRFLELVSTGNSWAALARINNVYWWVSVVHAFIRGRLLPSHAEIAARGANSLHNAPGGSRSKNKLIRDIWASGKYDNRDLCAEEEYAAVGYKGFSAARKSLRNTDNPDPWPGKKKPSRC